MNSALVKYDAALAAIAECRAVDEVKDWIDRSAAMKEYGRRAGNKTMEIDAAEIRIHAERCLGEMISAQKAGKGMAKPGPKSVVSNDRIPTLEEMEISRDMSSRAQKLAAVPQKEFESQVKDWRERTVSEKARVTTNLLKFGKKSKQAKAEKTKPAKPAKPAPAPVEDHGDMDFEKEFKRQDNEIRALEALVDSMKKDDKAAEIAKWSLKWDKLNGRVQQLMTTEKIAKEQAAYGTSLLAKIRKSLKVQKNSEILEAIADLKR